MSSDASCNGPCNPYDNLYSLSYVATNSVGQLSTIPQTRMYSTSAYSEPVNSSAFNQSVQDVNTISSYSTSYTTTNNSVNFKMKRFK